MSIILDKELMTDFAAMIPVFCKLSDTIKINVNVSASSDAPIATVEKSLVPEYVKESTHILTFTEEELNAWPDYWAKRKTSLYHYYNDKNGDSQKQDKTHIDTIILKANMDEKTMAVYNTEPYKHMIAMEIYHPQTFDLTFNNTDKSELKIYPPDTSKNSTLVRQLNEDAEQFNSKNKKKEHERRLEIAAKAAFMLYHSVSLEGIEKIEENKKNFIEVEENLYKIWKEKNKENSDIASNNYRVYMQTKTAINILDSIDKNHIFALIGDTKSSKDDLPHTFDDYRKASCYGLWGPWYGIQNDLNLGFHRGIDISFGGSNPIYSICKGRCVQIRTGANSINGLTLLTVEIDRPKILDVNYLTYMHADFKDIQLGDIIEIGDEIGTESNHMHGASGSYHTHIEVNSQLSSNNDKENKWYGTSKDFSNGGTIISTEPYDFIERCFADFYDALNFYEKSLKFYQPLEINQDEN
jgi:murein DD-endopeptidase MepM/ murein hydrolase activator NlpD